MAQQHDYKVVPAPTRGEKVKGVKGAAEQFAHALGQLMNRMASEGWEYLRAEKLPCEERDGWFGRKTTERHMLVFRRARPGEGAGAVTGGIRPTAESPATAAPPPVATVVMPEAPRRFRAPEPEPEPAAPAAARPTRARPNDAERSRRSTGRAGGQPRRHSCRRAVRAPRRGARTPRTERSRAPSARVERERVDASEHARAQRRMHGAVSRHPPERGERLGTYGDAEMAFARAVVAGMAGVAVALVLDLEELGREGRAQPITNLVLDAHNRLSTSSPHGPRR
jgi:hypothetical protein